MNERIRELVKEVGGEFWQRIESDGVLNKEAYITFDPPQSLEKFAELIVRECLTIIDNNNPCPPGTTIMYSFLQDEYFDKGWQVATETKANQIKRHFGVEE